MGFRPSIFWGIHVLGVLSTQCLGELGPPDIKFFFPVAFVSMIIMPAVATIDVIRLINKRTMGRFFLLSLSTISLLPLIPPLSENVASKNVAWAYFYIIAGELGGYSIIKDYKIVYLRAVRTTGWREMSYSYAVVKTLGILSSSEFVYEICRNDPANCVHASQQIFPSYWVVKYWEG